jgi:hypothetical protein
MVSIQNPYNLLNRSFEIGLAEVAMREQCGLLAYSPAGLRDAERQVPRRARPTRRARLTLFSRFSRYSNPRPWRPPGYVGVARKHGLDPAQMALAFVTSRPFVTSNIIGATTLEQLEQNLASIDLELSDEVLRDIEAVHTRQPNPSPTQCLTTLRSILEAVDRATSLDAALSVIVTEIRRSIDADVCSVWLTDTERREHVLRATDGLPAVGGRQAAYPAESGADRSRRGALRYRPPGRRTAASVLPRVALTQAEAALPRFLGVPHHPATQGARRACAASSGAARFDDEQLTFVLTLAVQLAGAIALARSSGDLGAAPSNRSLSGRFLTGIAAAPGIGVGTAYVVYPAADLDAVPDKPCTDVEANAFRTPSTASRQDLSRVCKRFGQTLRDEDQALFDAWRLMLRSDTFLQARPSPASSRQLGAGRPARDRNASSSPSSTA